MIKTKSHLLANLCQQSTNGETKYSFICKSDSDFYWADLSPAKASGKRQEHKTDKKTVLRLGETLVEVNGWKKSHSVSPLTSGRNIHQSAGTGPSFVIMKLKWDLKVKSYGKTDCPSG